jgi:hypothetical protein
MRSGVFRGLSSNPMTLRRLEIAHGYSTDRVGGDRHRQDPSLVCAVDAEGRPLLSVKVAKRRSRPDGCLGEGEWPGCGGGVGGRHHRGTVGADLGVAGSTGALVSYASGWVVNTMSTAFTGEGKTDAKDAYVIAETLRLRRNLPVIDTVTDLTRELALLTGHRTDLIADRVRMINRLRDVMTSVFPTLEQAFDYSSHKGALVLLSEYASPHRLRRLGEARLT